MNAGDVPWQALLWRPLNVHFIGRELRADERVLCGGSVIKTGWVLTAAHCLYDQGRPIFEEGGYTIRLGVHNPRLDEGTTYPIIKVYEHEDYDKSVYAYDIALIRYNPSQGKRGEGAFHGIGRVAWDRVPVERRRITEGMPVYVFGWGWTRPTRGTSTAELQTARLELSSPERCTEITGFVDQPWGGPKRANAALCAAGRNGEQSCYGDSGGPLIYQGDGRPVVIGVVSSGRACGTAEERESRYTRVAKVRDWIAHILETEP